MNTGKTIFSQIMECFPSYEFKKCVDKYKGDYRVRSYTCRTHFYVMAFAQLTFRESLRDIESSLKAFGKKLYQAGVRTKISKSTIADANENRDWRIYADFASVLIKIARPLYAKDEIGVDIDQMVYALDSTTIDLCLSLFPWAKFRRKKAAIKLHTLIDIHGNIPVFIWVTDGKVHDVNVLDIIGPEPNAIYLIDKAYVDFYRLYNLTKHHSYFVTRAKRNIQYKRHSSLHVDKSTGIYSDQTITLTGVKSSQHYPERLRRIHYFDAKEKRHLVFLTNNFLLSSITIVKLYKERWQVELFFKWIKQNLRIKSFYGTTINAVKTQIWTAICVYLVIAIIKKKLNIQTSLNIMLQVLSVSIFEKMPILQAFEEIDFKEPTHDNCIQLNLLDL